MKEVKAFKTSDGTLFDTASAAQSYENKKLLDPYLDGFLMSNACEYKTGPYGKIVRKSIIAWTQWLKENS